MDAEAVAMENAFVEGKILWLAQTILESTTDGKLGEWIRHAGLGEGMEKLTSEIERIETVVATAKGRANGNKPLARSLARLKELLYDADDLVDDFDYFRLQEQVEGGGSTIACVNDPEGTDGDGGGGGGGGGAEQLEGSRGNPDVQSKKRTNRSRQWDNFTEIRDANGKLVKAKCKYCLAEVSCGGTTGTRGLTAHFNSNKCHRIRQAHDQPPNPVSAMDAVTNDITETQDSFRGKRMRIDEASAHSTASNTFAWNKAKFSNIIHQIVSELQGLRDKVCEFLKDSVACSDQCQSNTDTQIRTSSFAPRKVYGRDVEKEYMIRVITAAESDSITVLPIVGIVGVGKTAVTQLVYNDPAVKSEFERIWVWVSDCFDEVRLTGEMLDVVCHEGSPHYKERHERIGNYSKLQEILQESMGLLSKRFLLVLDDVSDSMDNTRWKQLLAPLESSDKKGNVIVITTRDLSVARRLGTVEPRKLGALENDAFWLLFKACAFGDDNYEGHPSLTIIGRQIAAKLKGNPLAAETAGELLNEYLTIDHWSGILKSEDWKSMQFNKSIMHALKLSYDKLPYNVQQCFLYCSIFPDNYEFLAEDLVFTWISQGFMRRINSSKTPEQIGCDFLNYLVNLCFFEQVEKENSTLGNQLCYVMCGTVHDFARLISGTECAAIHGMEYIEMLPSIRHLSILTDSAYCEKDQHGNLSRNLKFEEKLRGVVTLATKLRTLVLIGKYDSFFFQSFADVFQKAQYLRMLQISSTYADFNYFMCKLVNSAHLRYLKLENKSGIEELHMPLSNFYHLQVLDVGHPAITSGINGLVSMRRLAVKKGAQVTDQHSITCFEILQSMNELVRLDVYQLENVSRAEADGAKLRDKQHLENLHLSWKDALSQDGYDSNSSSENHSNSIPEDYGSTSSENNSDSSREDYGNTSSENHSNSSPEDYGNTSSEHYRNIISGHYVGTEPEEDNCPINGANDTLISEQCTDTAKEVLEGLEPHRNLKHLQISGYNGATSPNWFSSLVLFTCLQTLHLEDCGEWQSLPSLESLLFLTKLKLKNMSKVTQVSIPPLEELVLIEMRKLERCFCNSSRDLNSSLRVLMIERCDVLKAFPLFESCDKLRIEHKSWLSGLSNLTVHDCPELIVSNPLPPSSSTCKLSILRVSTLPTMKGSSNGELIIGAVVEYPPFIDEDSNELRKLDDKILSFHNLRVLTHLKIAGCRSLKYVSLEGFKQLISLNSLEILDSMEFFSSDVLPEHALEEMETANFIAFPTLKHLSIISQQYDDPNKISGKWLSVMLRHAPVLEELHLDFCLEISGFLIEGKGTCLSNDNSSPRASSPGNPDAASTSSTRKGPVHFPSKLLSSLKKLFISFCYGLSFLEKKASFSAFTSLEELTIRECDGLMWSFVPKEENSDHANGGCLLPYSPSEPGILEPEPPEKIQLCPRMSANSLKKLELSGIGGLESLKLDSYTTLEELIIWNFPSLTALEGLQSLRLLRFLEVRCCSRLPPFLERLCGQVTELFPRLERLRIDDCSFLTTSFCMHLASLRCLHLSTREGEGLTGEQDRALQLIKTLQDLKFSCFRFVDLPVGLHSLPSLKRLGIIDCPRILRLPENGLPPSLEELEISCCSEELTGQCRALATRMLKVKIYDWYVYSYLSAQQQVPQGVLPRP